MSYSTLRHVCPFPFFGLSHFRFWHVFSAIRPTLLVVSEYAGALIMAYSKLRHVFPFPFYCLSRIQFFFFLFSVFLISAFHKFSLRSIPHCRVVSDYVEALEKECRDRLAIDMSLADLTNVWLSVRWRVRTLIIVRKNKSFLFLLTGIVQSYWSAHIWAHV